MLIFFAVVIFFASPVHINCFFLFFLSVLFLLHLFSLPVCITSSSSSPLSLSSSKTSHATKCSAVVVVVIYVHGLCLFCCCCYSNNLFDTMFAFTFVLRTAKVCCMEVFFFILFHLNIKFKWNVVVEKKEIDTHRHCNGRKGAKAYSYKWYEILAKGKVNEWEIKCERATKCQASKKDSIRTKKRENNTRQINNHKKRTSLICCFCYCSCSIHVWDTHTNTSYYLL